MVSFKDLKRNREKMFTELNAQIQNQGKRFSNQDDRFWYPKTDQSGNGFAIIRFLPAPGDETVPYVSMWSYGFKAKNGWYIENSRTTLGINERDPAHETNKALRAEGTKASIAKADGRKASISFISNIYVVRDPTNPENEGKVFLFRYGNKIFKNKLQAKMNPEFEGEEAMNPFDLWEGANLRLKISTTGKTAENPKGFRNYDASEWDSPGPLLPDDDAMEAIWKQTHSLQELISPDKFKSYEELVERFEKVTGESATPNREVPRQSVEPRRERTSTPPQEDNTPAPWEDDGTPSSVDSTSDPDDADLAYYENLLKDSQ